MGKSLHEIMQKVVKINLDWLEQKSDWQGHNQASDAYIHTYLLQSSFRHTLNFTCVAWFNVNLHASNYIVRGIHLNVQHGCNACRCQVGLTTFIGKVHLHYFIVQQLLIVLYRYSTIWDYYEQNPVLIFRPQNVHQNPFKLQISMRCCCSGH